MKRKSYSSIQYQWGDTLNLRLYQQESYQFMIHCDKSVCHDYCARFDLTQLSSLIFKGYITAKNDDSFLLNCHIKATFGQLCATTHDEIVQYIDEHVTIHILPKDINDDHISIDDDVDYHDDFMLDFSELLIQNFAVLLPPFARKNDDKKMESSLIYRDDHDNNPFAVLASLKTLPS